MLFDDLQHSLKELIPDLETITAYWNQSHLDSQFQQLEKESQDPDFWQRTDQTEILKELQRVRLIREQYQYITHTYKEIGELLSLFQEDQSELEIIAQEIRTLKKAIASFKINLLMGEPEDSSNCFVDINAGAGGTESQDWALMLMRMFTRFCEREKLSVQLIDSQGGEEAGIKSATLFIKGKNAYGLLKSEQGIHRLVRISPFDAAKRRHTSFAAVSVTPEAPDQKIVIDPADLRIDTYRAGGAGGQHVNKTESAVRITHIPTGVVAQCQNERSQMQNKETAMKMLQSRLVQRQKEENAAKLASKEKKKIEWGSQIRSYVLHPYKMVKDHRTGCESPQPDLILDGDLMEFIERYLIWRAKED